MLVSTLDKMWKHSIVNLLSLLGGGGGGGGGLYVFSDFWSNIDLDKVFETVFII